MQSHGDQEYCARTKNIVQSHEVTETTCTAGLRQHVTCTSTQLRQRPATYWRGEGAHAAAIASWSDVSADAHAQRGRHAKRLRTTYNPATALRRNASKKNKEAPLAPLITLALTGSAPPGWGGAPVPGEAWAGGFPRDRFHTGDENRGHAHSTTRPSGRPTWVGGFEGSEGRGVAGWALSPGGENFLLSGPFRIV